jgi:hypothetical protein
VTAKYDPHIRLSYEETESDFIETFRKWGVKEWDLHSSSRRSQVILTYVVRNTPVRLEMNRFQTRAENARVLYLGVEAMRLNELRGITDVIQQAYLQLAAPAQSRDPWEVLGVRPDADPDVIKAAYNAKAKKLHPDAGGNPEEFKALVAAWEAVRKGR